MRHNALAVALILAAIWLVIATANESRYRAQCERVYVAATCFDLFNP